MPAITNAQVSRSISRHNPRAETLSSKTLYAVAFISIPPPTTHNTSKVVTQDLRAKASAASGATT